MSKKSKEPPQEEVMAFYKAMPGIKPLVHKKIRLAKKPLRPPTIQHPIKESDSFEFTEKESLSEVKGDEFIAFKQASVSHKILRKLRKGQYNVEAVLDLHGMSVEKAKIAVNGFLRQSLQRGVRVALIIHGRGRHRPVPVLKNKLNHWLRELNVVLAFCSAAFQEGSRGAIYVLLKRTGEVD